MGKKSSIHHAREIWAVILVGLSLLLLLSLLSYNPYDVGNSVGSRPHIRNFIGPVGAWIGYLTFSTWGLGAYVLMLVLATVGSMLLLGREVPWRGKVWAGLLLLISSACLLHLIGFESASRRLNLPSAGGFVGMFVADFTGMLVGNIGAFIIFAVAYLVSLILLINFTPSYWVVWAADNLSALWEGIRQLTKPTASDSLVREERALKAKELKLNRELARRERQARKLAKEEPAPAPEPIEEEVAEVARIQRPEPKIEDRSVHRPTAIEDPDPEEAEPVLAEIEKRPKLPARSKSDKGVATSVLGTVTAGAGEEYVLPPLDLLEAPPAMAQRNVMEDLKASATVLRETLADFGIEVESGDVTKGPTITRFEVYPAPGVKVEKISSLSNNIALAMKAERVRILAPVPGKGTVGIEVPNATTTTVYLRDILESAEWRNAKAAIPIALGRDVSGNPIIADLAAMPHMLIAGATGSGKTVCVNSILAALLYKFTAENLRLVLIDPKVVEMQNYNVLPHLIVPVVTEAKKVPLALRWVINEMEKRFQIFAKVGVRNIASFNSRPIGKPKAEAPELDLEAKAEDSEAKADANDEGTESKDDQQVLKIEVPREDDFVIPEKLPYIVVVVDELADLMLTCPADVEMAVARLTALGRAAGIHLLIATQRPSVDVLTGVIKANIPARVAFQVSSKQDSRVILDANGADKLMGKGDMLYLPPGSAKLIRAQGVLVLDDEVRRIVDFIGDKAKPQFEQEIHQKLARTTNLPDDIGDGADEELIEQAIEVIRQSNRASVSSLQRRMRIGYTRAARIMDILEERGVVGPNKGAEPRDILIDLEAGVPSQ